MRELRKILNEADLRVAAVTFRTRSGYDTPERLDRRVAATKEALKFAYQLRAPIVVNHVGRVPAESSGPAWQSLVEVLADLAGFGQRTGARLAAQTGSESGADLARLLAALPPQGIAIDFDPAALLVAGFSPAEAISALAADVAQLRARDAVRDLARSRAIEVPLGRGAVDLPAILAALEERGFRGSVVVGRDGAEDPAGEMADAISYLRSL